MPHSIAIADARWLAEKSIATVASRQEKTAWYLGDDYALYLRLRENLGSDLTWGDAGPRLTGILAENRSAFTNIDRGFNIWDPDWWECRNISERGPYSSNFTADCCRYLLFRELLSQDDNILFVVERADLARLLLNKARALDINVTWLGPGPVQQAFANLFTTTRSALRFVRAFTARARRVFRLQLKRRRHPAPLDRLAACDALFAVWTDSRDFARNGERELAHSMGMLPTLLRRNGHNVGFIALPLTEVSEPEAIEQSILLTADAVILPDDTIGPAKVLMTAIHTLIDGAGPIQRFMIGAQPVEHVARMVMAREKFDWRAVNARLWSNIGPYLARHGCRPKVLFHVYEGQTWEKGLRQGIHRSMPETRVVGIHQSPFSMLYLNMIPSHRELASGRWPHAVLTFGQNSRRMLTEHGAPHSCIETAGLLREEAFIQPNIVKKSGTIRKILCATGPGHDECLELTHKCAAAIDGLTDLELIINFHPLTARPFRENVQQFLKLHAARNRNIRFSDLPIKDLLDQGVSAVFYADTSSGFEGISAGAKAINVSRDIGPSFDKLPAGLARPVRSVAEIRQTIIDLDDDEKWPTEHEVKKILGACFSKIDLPVIMRLSGLAPANGNCSKYTDQELNS